MKVNCRKKHREIQQAKDAERLGPKGKVIGYSSPVLEYVDIKITGGEARPTLFLFIQMNTVIPMLSGNGKETARKLDGAAGKGG